MSLFTTILEKIGLSKPAAPVATAPKPAPAVDKGEKDTAPAAKPAAAPSKPAAAPVQKSVAAADDVDDMRHSPAASVAARPAAVSEVDVVAKLEKMAAGSGLNWKVSIVDLLKILGIDSSLNARKELAKELNCPAEMMGGDSTKMNIWLHKEVLKKIAENGGNIPQDLLK